MFIKILLICAISIMTHNIYAGDHEKERDVENGSTCKFNLGIVQQEGKRSRGNSFIDEIEVRLANPKLTESERLKLQLEKNKWERKGCVVYKASGTGEIVEREKLRTLQTEADQITVALRLAHAKEKNVSPNSAFRALDGTEYAVIEQTPWYLSNGRKL